MAWVRLKDIISAKNAPWLAKDGLSIPCAVIVQPAFAKRHFSAKAWRDTVRRAGLVQTIGGMYRHLKFWTGKEWGFTHNGNLSRWEMWDEGLRARGKRFRSWGIIELDLQDYYSELPEAEKMAAAEGIAKYNQWRFKDTPSLHDPKLFLKLWEI